MRIERAMCIERIRLKKAEFWAEVPTSKQPKTKIRIVCQELEAWYIAQPVALEQSKALKKALSKSQLAKNPDLIKNPKRIFKKYAHEKGQLVHARAIGPYLDPNNKNSKSFGHFIKALKDLSNL